MDKQSLSPAMTQLPYKIREFYENEAKRQNKSFSAILREILTNYYAVKLTIEKMEV